MTALVATCLKSIMVGALDAIEYNFFNDKVYYLHNFPDIVPHMEPGTLAAFVSGVKCSWFLYAPLGILHSMMGVSPRTIALVSAAEVGGSILFMLINRGHPDIFLNHKFFYSALAVGEVATLFMG